MAKNNRRFDNGEIDFLLGDVAISEMEDGRDIPVAPFKKLPTWQTIGWGIGCNPLESYFPGFLPQAFFGELLRLPRGLCFLALPKGSAAWAWGRDV